MTDLKKQPHLSEVTLEHAMEIINPLFQSDFQLSKGLLYDNYNNYKFNDEGILYGSHGGSYEQVSYMCMIRAVELGYYVPKLSEKLKIKELEGMIKVYKSLYSRPGFHEPDEIAALEKEIEELKQGEFCQNH